MSGRSLAASAPMNGIFQSLGRLGGLGHSQGKGLRRAIRWSGKLPNHRRRVGLHCLAEDRKTIDSCCPAGFVPFHTTSSSYASITVRSVRGRAGRREGLTSRARNNRIMRTVAVLRFAGSPPPQSCIYAQAGRNSPATRGHVIRSESSRCRTPSLFGRFSVRGGLR
jgi:hypothetical protein